MTSERLSRRNLLALPLALGVPGLPFAAAAQGSRSALNLAMVAEPQTLDPMASTADLVGTIMQHVYETLYTFDAKWNVVPMLAEAMPKVSADGKTSMAAHMKQIDPRSLAERGPAKGSTPVTAAAAHGDSDEAEN